METVRASLLRRRRHSVHRLNSINLNDNSAAVFRNRTYPLSSLLPPDVSDRGAWISAKFKSNERLATSIKYSSKPPLSYMVTSSRHAEDADRIYTTRHPSLSGTVGCTNERASPRWSGRSLARRPADKEVLNRAHPIDASSSATRKTAGRMTTAAADTAAAAAVADMGEAKPLSTFNPQRTEIGHPSSIAHPPAAAST